MKKLFFLLQLLFITALVWPAQAHADIYTNFGRVPGVFKIGNLDTGSLTSFVLDSNFVRGVSGDAAGLIFSSPVTQTNGDLTYAVTCSAVTGVPNESVALIYAGPSGAENANQPTTLAMATSTNVDASGCATTQWLYYTFTDSVSLVQGKTYFIFPVNMEASPATNNFSVVTRGTMDTFGTFNANLWRFFSTTDGFLTNPSINSAIAAPNVLIFDDTTIMGNPWVGTASHANNQNTRGGRIALSGSINVSGVNMNIGDTAFLIASTSIYNGSTLVQDTEADRYQENATALVHYYTPVSLAGATAYDFVARYSGNDNSGEIRTMGNGALPSFAALNPIMYVDGTTGALVASSTATFLMDIFFDDVPAAAPAPSGGAAGGSLKVRGGKVNVR